MQSKTGVVLLNVGTPDAPRTAEVRRYLRQFLMDANVIDIPVVWRWLLVNGAILPFRPQRSAEAYASIWSEAGSPLLVESRALAAGAQEALGQDYIVEVGMRYGNPSIEAAVDRLKTAGATRLVGLPMFPQFAQSSTITARDRLIEVAESRGYDDVAIVDAFYHRDDFIEAWLEVARPPYEEFAPDHVLFSYHGLPERHIRRLDRTGEHCLEKDDCCASICEANQWCYRAHCYATTRAIARGLGLSEGGHMTAFQSRLGRDPWIKPYTDVVLKELAERGVKRLLVLCPAFVADCLETLEEIGIRAKEDFLSFGGEALELVPSLNRSPRWVSAVAAMVQETEVSIDRKVAIV